MPPARRRYTAQRAGGRELHSAAGGTAPGSNHSRSGCRLLASDGARAGAYPCVFLCVCVCVCACIVVLVVRTLPSPQVGARFSF